MRKMTYYIGVTLDGFIADPDGAVDFFPVDQPMLEFIAAEFPETLPTHVRSALGLAAAGDHFDTVVMGRGTYAPALDAGITSPYAHLQQYVVSTTLAADTDPKVQVVAGDPLDLVRRLKRVDGKGVWLAGGGQLAGAVLPEIDDLVLKRYPVVIGAGIPAISAGHAEPLPFTLTDTRILEGGTTVSTYTRTAMAIRV